MTLDELLERMRAEMAGRDDAAVALTAGVGVRILHRVLRGNGTVHQTAQVVRALGLGAGIWIYFERIEGEGSAG